MVKVVIIIRLLLLRRKSHSAGESKIGYARDIWKKGDKVQIKFNANDPSDFFIVHESIPTWVWLISIGIGFAVISVFGAVICYFAAKY